MQELHPDILRFELLRPHTRVVLAMTVDGKIADRTGQAARFGSQADRAHLEKHIAAVDGVLLGAGTLRAYGSSLAVRDPILLQQRQLENRSPQPVQILCSASGNLDPQWRFFQQPFPRWLITGQSPQQNWWHPEHSSAFDRIFVEEITMPNGIDGQRIAQILWQAGLRSVAVLGGGTLVASLLEQGIIDDLYLTLCPFILGGRSAPTAVEGQGFLENAALGLTLCSVDRVEDELFLHYHIPRSDQFCIE